MDPMGNRGDEYLYQTAAGDFFLLRKIVYLDGRMMGPIENMPPELLLGTAVAARKRRTRLKEKIIPMSAREALLWCVKTQIPETLRGYLLDCI